LEKHEAASRTNGVVGRSGKNIPKIPKARLIHPTTSMISLTGEGGMILSQDDVVRFLPKFPYGMLSASFRE
jgi:hypothetical protein